MTGCSREMLAADFIGCAIARDQFNRPIHADTRAGQLSLVEYNVLMNYFIFWILGFGTLWAGLKLFDDEVFLIATLFVGSGLVLAGLFSSPAEFRAGIEVVAVISLFHVCMECIGRGGSQK